MAVSHRYSLFLDLGTRVGDPGQTWGNKRQDRGKDEEPRLRSGPCLGRILWSYWWKGKGVVSGVGC